ncbi:MAG: hypothetical protein ACXADY_02910 [Candidatus Hodarchaeales archaeon]
MSGSEFKTDSEVKTSSKYDSRTDYKTYRQGDYRKELSSMDSSDVDSMIDDMSYRELRSFKKSLGIKGKGNTKASLKRSIKAHLSKEQTSQQAKTIDTMSLAELRVVGQKYGVKTGGVKKDVLKQRVKRKMGEIEESEEFQNLPEGSITSITHEGEEFAVDLIDKDVEPHKKVEIKKIDDSVFAVNQETMLGEKEVIMVTVRDSDESLKRKLKEKEDNVLASQTSDIDNNIMTKIQSQEEGTSPSEIKISQSQDKEELEKNLNDLSYSELRDIVNLNDLGWKRGRYTKKRGAIKGGTKGGRPSKKEYIQAILREENVILPPDLEKKRIASRQKKISLTEGESHEINVDTPVVDSATVSFPKSWIQAEVSHKKNKTELNKARRQKKNYPEKWDTDEKLAKQLERNRKIMEDYQREKKIPFYEAIESGSQQSRVSNDLIPLEDFDNLPKVDIIAEKTTKGYLTDEQVRMNTLSAGGNNIQASIDENMRFQGLYFQDGSQDKPLPHFAKFDKIIVDSDDTGYYTAYFTNYYVYDNPFKENVWINVDRKQTKLSLKTKAEKYDYEFRAMRFFAQQIVNSSAYRRNMAVQDTIKKDLDTALKYRTATGQTKDVKISEQKLAICDFIYQERAYLEIQTPEQTITLPYEIKDIPEGKPELLFDYSGKYEPLNSDDLLEIGTERYGLEPDSVQAILENLYHSGWINYPRADLLKAEDEPIHLLRPYEEYKGTTQERQILKVIHDSETSNYIKKGTWKLKVDNQVVAQESGFVYGNDPFNYSEDQFDIKIRRKGTTPSDLIKYLNRNNISTPATRTAQLAELKQAGIITLIDKHYVLDKRGIAFKAAYDYYNEYSFNAIDLNNRIKQAKNSDEILLILDEIEPISRKETRQIIKQKANSLIEAQDDLAELEEF